MTQEENILELLESIDRDNIALGLQLVDSIAGELPEALKVYKFRHLETDGQRIQRILDNVISKYLNKIRDAYIKESEIPRKYYIILDPAIADGIFKAIAKRWSKKSYY